MFGFPAKTCPMPSWHLAQRPIQRGDAVPTGWFHMKHPIGWVLKGSMVQSCAITDVWDCRQIRERSKWMSCGASECDDCCCKMCPSLRFGPFSRHFTSCICMHLPVLWSKFLCDMTWHSCNCLTYVRGNGIIPFWVPESHWGATFTSKWCSFANDLADPDLWKRTVAHQALQRLFMEVCMVCGGDVNDVRCTPHSAWIGV